MSETIAIEAEDLRRIFNVRVGALRSHQKQVVALDSVSFQVKTGEVFGLIGRNGAGKTTIVKILSTLLLPTSGTATVLGFDVAHQEQEVRRRIAFMLGGERGLYWRLSGRHNLEYFAELYGVEPALAGRRIQHALEFVGLAERQDEKVQGYSRGMMQRLHVARLLITDPEVLYLDEPTVGMDPLGAKDMREAVKRLKSLGKTVFLTSHNMVDIDVLCDRVAVIDKGRIIELDTPAGLKHRVSDLTSIELELSGSLEAIVGHIERLPWQKSITSADGANGVLLRISAPNGTSDLQTLLKLLSDVPIKRIIFREPTLDDVYERLLGKQT